jgi:hypothetical protein
MLGADFADLGIFNGQHWVLGELRIEACMRIAHGVLVLHDDPTVRTHPSERERKTRCERGTEQSSFR